MVTVPIELPQVGESVVEGIIEKWLKKPGDKIEKYDPLVEVVTDKVNMEMPAPFSGTLTRILAEEGATIPVGAVIAEMDITDAEAAAWQPKLAQASETIISTMGVLVESNVSLGPTGSPTAEEAPVVTPVPATERRGLYSPVVMRLAAEHNVDVSQVVGTGINGRVTKKDVLKHLKQGQSAITRAPVAAAVPISVDDEEAVIEPSPIRRIIAQNMVKSSTQIPHAWAMMEVDVTNLVALRQSVRSQFKQKGQDITIFPFIIHAVASGLSEHPYLNATWRDDKIVLKKRIHLGIAVSAPSGLVVPVIHNADRLSVDAANSQLRTLAENARRNSLSLEQVQGGTFTLNNTGALGTTVSGPIINYPQAAILSTEAVVQRPVVINNAIAIRSMMNLCLSFDHRIVDGAEASAFLKGVKDRLEAIGPDTPVV
jgi:2-oxoisovalerate dehydrogenase E2 component (dihydrolipoyl transacylase)